MQPVEAHSTSAHDIPLFAYWQKIVSTDLTYYVWEAALRYGIACVIWIIAALGIGAMSTVAASFPVPATWFAAMIPVGSELYVREYFWFLRRYWSRIPLALSFSFAIYCQLLAMCAQFAYFAICVQLTNGRYIWPEFRGNRPPGLLAWPLLVPHCILLAGWLAGAGVHAYLFVLRRKGLGPILQQCFHGLHGQGHSARMTLQRGEAEMRVESARMIILRINDNCRGSNVMRVA